MRISDNRYSRDLRRHNLAWQMIAYEARTGTIRAWTGLTGSRIRRLYETYTRGQEKKELPRHRGMSPFQLQYFTRSRQIRREAALFGGTCRLMRILPAEPLPNAASVLPSLHRGEMLCLAYETFRELYPDSDISFERAVLLVLALAEANILSLARCEACRAVTIINRLDRPRTSQTCHASRNRRSRSGNVPEGDLAPDESERSDLQPGKQGRLFD
jgi:Flagellar transcriptional activator (FlhC)